MSNIILHLPTREGYIEVTHAGRKVCLSIVEYVDVEAEDDLRTDNKCTYLNELEAISLGNTLADWGKERIE